MTEQIGDFIVGIGLFILFIAVITKYFANKSSIMVKKVCRDCWFVSEPAQNSKLRGSGSITLILLCFYLIPGIIYMIWRRGDKTEICQKCHGKNLIPIDSPLGQKLLNDHKIN